MAKEAIADEHSRTKLRVAFLDAAVLLEAGWQTDEIWVTFVPREEQIKRIQERDSKTEEQAQQRIESQLSNETRIKHANVLLSTIWEPEVTRQIVKKAWTHLMD